MEISTFFNRYIIAFAFVLLTSLTYGQRNYATTERSVTTGICLGCSVNNETNAADGNVQTFSTLSMGVAVGATIFQDLIFPVSSGKVPAGKPVTVKLGTGDNLLNLTLLGGISLQAYDGQNTPAGPAVTLSTLISVLSSNNQTEVSITPTANYDRVRITLNGGLLGALSNFYIYDAFYNGTGAGVCNSAVDEIHGISSALLNLGLNVGGVVNPQLAIDGNLTTAATLNAGIGLLGASAQETAIFQSPSILGDSVRVTFTVPQSLLSASVLSNISVTSFIGNTSNNDTQAINSGLLNLQLLGLIGTSQKVVVTYVPSKLFDRIQVSLGGGIANVLSTVDLYEIQKIIPSPVIKYNNVATNNVQLCANSTASLIASALPGTIFNWYTQPANGTPIFTGTNFTTPVLTANTTYYVEAVRTGCTDASARTPVTITVNQIPAAPVITNSAIAVCPGQPVTFVAQSTAGISINWYTAATGGIPVFTGNNFTTPVLTQTTTYYAEAVAGGTCISPTRTAVTATISALPGAPVLTAGNITICDGDVAVFSIASPVAGITYNWYSAATDGTLLSTGTNFTSPALHTNTIYYVEAVNATGCTSTQRTLATVTVQPKPADPILAANNATVVAGNSTTINVTNAQTGITYNWYTSATASTPVATGSSFQTPILFSTTTYYAGALNSTGCQSANRTPVTINVTTTAAPCSFANTQTPDINGLCILCSVTNNNLATDGDTTTASTLSVPVGLLNAYAGQQLVFQQPGLTGDIIKLGLQTPVSLANVALLSQIQVVLFNGATQVASYTLDNSLIKLTLLSGGDKSIALIPATGNYDRISVRLLSGAASLLSSLQIYYAIQQYPNPVINPVSPEICNGSTAQLNITSPTTGSFAWFTTPTGGSAVNTTNQFTTPALTASTTYYIEYTRNGCTSATRYPVLVLVDAPPANPTVAVNNVTINSGQTATLTANAANNATIKWYSAATGGAAIFTGSPFTTPALTTGTTYYAEASLGNCTSPTRTPVTVTVNAVVIPDVTVAPLTQSVNAGQTATLIASSTTPGAIFNWFSAATGGTSLFTGSTFTTPPLFANTSYYAEASVPATGAVSATRASGSITVNSTSSSPTPCDAATIQTNAIVGLCLLCAVNNSPAAVDQDRNTFSQLNVPVGLLTAYAQQTLQFTSVGRMGDSVIVELGTPASLATVGVLSQISLATYNGTTYNNDRFAINGALLNITLLNGTNRFRIAFKATADFDRVEIRLNSGVAGVLNSLNVYDASEEVAPPVVAASTVTICQGTQATLVAAPVPSYVTIKWYATATSVTPLFTGATFNTPVLNASTTYYAEASRTADGCAQLTRTPVTVTVTPTPAAPVVTNPTATACSGQPVTFTAQTVSGVTFNWYNAPTGGTLLFTGNAFTTPALTATTSYFVEADGTGQCGSATRTQVTATINNVLTIPVVTQATPQTCAGSPAVLTATSTQPGVTFNWYTTATGGAPVFTGAQFITPALTANTSYFVEASSGTCTSATRAETDVVVSPVPTAPTVVIVPPNAQISSGQTASITASSTTAGVTFNWYTTATGGTPIFTGAAFTTPALTNTTTYYVEAANSNGCVSTQRTAATINIITVFSTTCDFASSQTTDVNGGVLCVGCGVDNPTNVSDQDTTNFSQLNLPIAVLGSYVSQKLIFSDAGGLGDTVAVKIALPVSLATVGVLDQIQIASYNGSTYNNDRVNISSSLIKITLLSGGQTAIIKFAPQVAFDRVEIRLNSAVASVFNAVDLFYATKQVEAPKLAATTINICGGNVATFTVSNARAGLTYNWYATATSTTSLHSGTTFTTPALTASTTYYVESRRTTNSCPNPNRVAATANVTPTPVVPTFTQNNLSICAGDNVTLAVNNAAGATVNWYDAATGGNLLFTGATFQVSPIANISYYAELTNGTCPSPSRAQANVIVNPRPSMPGVISANVQVCIGSPAILQVNTPEAGVTYNWYTTATGGTIASSGTSFITPPITQSTTYYVEAANTISGCINNGGRTAVNVTNSNQAASPLLNATQTQVCNGGTASIIVINPVAGLTYNWYTAATGGAPIFTGTTYTINNLTANVSYFVEAVTVGGCMSASRTETDITVLPIPPTPVVVAPAGGLTTCNGSQATLSISNPQNDLVYRWFDAATGGSLLFTGTQFTTPALTTNATYYVEAVSAGNCNPSARAAVTVTVSPIPPDPIVTANSVAVCAGSSATLSVSNPQTGISYNWYDSPARTNLLFTGVTYITGPITTTSNFYVASANTSGCVSVNLAQVQVSVQTPPQAPAIANGNTVPVCNGSAVTLSIANPQPGYTYNWYNAASGVASVATGITFNIPAVTSGLTYYAEAINASGCISATRTEVDITLSNPATPVLSATQTQICKGGNVTLSVTNSVTGLVYNWYTAATGGTLAFTGITFNVNNITASTSYYVEAVNGTCASTAKAETDITILPPPSAPTVVAPSGGFSVCSGAVTTISISNPDAGLTYNWFDSAAGGTLLFTGTQFITPVLTATTTYYVEASSAANCSPSARTTVTISVNPLPPDPTVTASSVTVCTGSNATLSVSSPQAGVSYNWYDSAAKTNLLFTGVTYLTGSINTTTSFYVSASNSSGCSSTNLAQVQVITQPVPQAPAITNSGTVSICSGSTTTLSIANSQAGFTYNWYTVATGSAPVFTGVTFVTPAISQNTTYYAEAVSDLGCSSTTRTAANVTMTTPTPAPQVNTQGTSICPGSTTILSAVADPNVTINWYANASGGTSLATGNNFTTPVINANTTYYAEATNNTTGCISTTRTAVAIQLVKPLDAPVVTVGTTTTSSIIFQWSAVTGATGYEVSIDNGLTFISAGNNLSYKVSGLQYDQSVTIVVRTTGSTSCQLSANSLAVTGLATNPLDDGIFVPNAFTPNNDGKNDILYVYGTNIKGLNLWIYDQWGEMQFKSASQSSGWDGTYKGRAQPVGVYIYYLEATMNNGQVIQKKGTITLLR